MRRHILVPLLTVAAGVVLALAAAVTNYATENAPEFFKDPWRVGLSLAVLVLVAVLIELMILWPRQADSVELAPGPAAPRSLRPPSVGAVVLRGRESELARAGAKTGLVVICGPGGMGKTTLAAAVAAERSGQTVFWIRWQDPETLTALMIEVACTLGLPTASVDAAQKSGASIPDLVWRHLASVRRWTLVLDNIDDPTAVSPAEPLSTYRSWIRPSDTGLVLVTSRDRSPETWGRDADLVDLSPLSPPQGGRILCDLAPQAGPVEDAEALSARLGGLPLALHAAGTALASPTARLRTFAALTDKSAAVLPPRPDASDRETARKLVGYTWELSLDDITDEGHPLARPLLRALSLLAEAPIPIALITPALLSEGTQPEVDAALAQLHRYGLIDTRTDPTPAVVLHPLVRETNQLLDNSLQPTVDAALMNFTTTTAAEGRPGWPTLHLLAPHLIALTALDDVETFTDARDVLTVAASELSTAGNAATTAALRQRILQTDLAHLGDSHTQALTSQSNFANALGALGRYSEAINLHRVTLDARRRILGADHADTLASQNNLAKSLQNLGQHNEAAELHRATLETRRRILGDNDLRTLNSQNNLAAALVNLEQHNEATELHHITLEARRRILGEDHPDTLASQNNCANALSSLGRHHEAIDLHRSTLEKRHRILGGDHPQTLISQNNLAITLDILGHHSEAAELHRTALEARCRTLGEDHPDTLVSQHNLAIAERAARRWWWRR
ncbi:FxSxx-COOH system tetratricopeptide repeat protein [Actinokineospora diospyrosa]|uniref:Tetratricopeptide (TPR) repeat n=1 Tax=Actinokineospora diospyrosa TaxID=103728 RepID=A0ABT1IID7_9PSEU|nr:FxSxx-COOH system tetratricopeptide repeat protein [Actinokineospora diospyrosa]MCP2272422.1 Tetratricopeptide (TPR) repeat [Actinokineospora diospyrosa]